MDEISPRANQMSSTRLLQALNRAVAKLETIEQSKNEPVAIVGLGCRFPQAKDPEEFWQLLRDGTDAITEVPPERWHLDTYYDPNPDTPGKIYTRWGGFLEAVDEFDPQFFGISPREAAQIDPQQRLLLEVSWEALENAGLVPEHLFGSKTGVFVGITTNDYARLLTPDGDLSQIDSYFLAGNPLNAAAGRLSYTLGLRGPSLAIDTACSSSLVTVHSACQSLRNRECDLALAGGVNLILSPENTVALCRARMMAADGRCKTFDAAADGFVRGEGCGIIVLKRLSDAIAAKDRILALIKGSAVNQDGASSGFTVPNKTAQQELIRQALAMAKIEPAEVDYIEAHGTGTSLGDPIEVRALAAVLGAGRSPDSPLIIGSVKTNIGHLESAAGIAGLIKVVIALQHREIPPHLHFQQPNPYIDWDKLPVVVPQENQPWSVKDKRRVAGVSSFGASGTNAHVVLEEAPLAEERDANLPERPEHLLTISAKTETALRELAQRYHTYLATHPNVSLADICFTSNCGRSHFPHRLSVVASSTAELSTKLGAYTASQETPDIFRGQVQEATQPKIAWLFTGEGSQYVRMGRQLYETQPVFRQAIDRCESILQSYLDKPLREIIYPPISPSPHLPIPQSLLNQTQYTQPALFAIEYALAQLWQSWGIQPEIFMGHGVGEYVAASVAGVFSLEDALKLIVQRGRLMQSLSEEGATVAVFANEELVRAAIQPYLEGVAIAAINGPEHIVISGRRNYLETIIDTSLKIEKIKTSKLKVAHGFPFPASEPILTEFERVATAVTYSPPQIKIISSVTGKLASAEIATPQYWCRHLCQPVRFDLGLATLWQQNARVLVEIGSKPTLLEISRQNLSEEETNNLAFLPSLTSERSDWQQMLQSLGQLYVRGIAVDWSGFHQEPYRSIELPTYPFQRQRYWSESLKPTFGIKSSCQKEIEHPLLDKKLQSPLLQETLFESYLSINLLPFLQDHRVYQQIVVPGAYYIALLLGASQLTSRKSECQLENILFHQAMAIAEEESRIVQLALAPQEAGSASFKIISLATDTAEDNSWQVHGTGKIFTKLQEVSVTATEPSVLNEIQMRCPEQLDGREFYRVLGQRTQIVHGLSFRWIETIWRGNGEALCLMKVPYQLNRVEADWLHPGLVDSCFQLLAATTLDLATTFVPLSIEKFRFFHLPQGSQLWCHASLRRIDETEKEIVGDIQLFDSTGEAIAEIIGLTFRKASLQALLHSIQPDLNDWLYEITWVPQHRKANRETLSEVESGSWLVFADRGGVGVRLMRELQARGDRCIVVTLGSGYLKADEDRYQVNPTSPEDFRRLLKESFSDRLPLRGVLHLWSLAELGQDLTLQTLQQAQVTSCASALHLVQALATAQWSKSPRLWLVTQGSQRVETMPNSLQVQQSPLWGLGHTISLEHPDLRCTCLDLDPSTTAAPVSNLLAELLSPDLENRIAYRQGVRYLARLVKHQAALSKTRSEIAIRGDASYLITGGLGALGLKVARWLVERGARSLALIGRSETSTTAQETVEQLEQQGAKISIVRADVSNQEEMAGVLDKICAAMPPLKGIIHAAGRLDDGVLLNLDWERLRRVMAPKVAGAWNLHFLTKDLPLDFFVCFSSVSSILGSPGQGNYAAANAFLDALSHHRQELGLSGLSINWGPWADSGMAAKLGNRDRQRLIAEGIAPIPSQRGLQVLGELLGSDTAQVGVLPVNWSKFLQQFAPHTPPPLFSELSNKMRSPSKQLELLERLQTASPEARHSLLTTYLRERIARVLGLNAARIDAAASLNNLGLDSLMAIELRNLAQTELALDIPVVKFIEDLSIVSLATQLSEQLVTDAETPSEFLARSRSESQRLLRPKRTEPSYEVCSTEGTSATQLRAALTVGEIEHNNTMFDLDKEVEPEAAGQILNQLERLSDREVETLLQSISEGKE